MNLTDISKIEIRPRQRTIDATTVSQLKASILTKGLFHPIVITVDRSTGGEFLVCGEHRLRAIIELHNEGKTFLFNGSAVPPGKIPTVNLAELSPADLLEAELEENIVRSAIPWQDRARALAAIHQLRQQENPSQTFSDTAKEVAERGGGSSDWLRTEIKNAVILASAMDRPSVAKARTAAEAMLLLYKEEEAKVQAELARRRSVSTPQDVRVVCGDMREVMLELPEGQIDLIIADLPYGIGADTAGFRKRTVEHHNYDDSFDSARNLMQFLLTEGFRVTKPRANIFIFGDVDLFPFFKEVAMRMAWKPFRTPIIWGKGSEESGPAEGLAPWGREGFRRSYEMIFFATKGNKGLLQSPVDVILERRVPRNERRYGAEKPVPLLRRLIECATLPGDSVLDPCCGAGSTLVACKQLYRKGLGIEVDQTAADLALAAISSPLRGEEGEEGEDSEGEDGENG